MILNSEFWDALTTNQRRKFAKANCEATYKKAIIYQIVAAVLFPLVVGLFLPIGNNARRYFKGYYSLREEDMPITVKILCVLDFVFGLFANLFNMFTTKEQDYGMFKNTLSRPALEAMLNETDAPTAMGGVSGDPFRITNFSDSAVKPRESKPVRKGCEKFDAIWLIVISAVTIALIFVMYIFALPALFNGSNSDDTNSTVSVNVTTKTESKAPEITLEDFSEATQKPSTWNERVEMQVVNASSGLRLRAVPSSASSETIITTIPNKTVVIALNTTDVTDWYFVAYEDKAEGRTRYGWACVKNSGGVYLDQVEKPTESEETSSEEIEPTLTTAQVKEKVKDHLTAICHIESGFFNYLTTSKAMDDVGNPTEIVKLGVMNEGTSDETSGYTYIRVVKDADSTDSVSVDALKTYLKKYMIDSAITKSLKITEVTDTVEAVDELIINYQGDDAPKGLYINYDLIKNGEYACAIDYENFESTEMQVMDTELMYTVTTTINYGTEAKKLTVYFRYKSNSFKIATYTVDPMQ